jgi:parvulin-like peptidyl-prolyl isomerase
MPWDKFINELREGLLLKRYVEDEVASYASVSDDDIMKAFKRNPTAFDIPEKARARHILFRIESDNVDDTEGRAKQALERITSGATSFEEYATNYSDDKVTAQRGGDLGEFSRGTMLPEFDTAVFSLEPGAISTPIKTKYGIHLIKVEQKTPKVIATLENSKELVRQKLITQARAEALSKHIQTLQDKAVIVVIDPAYRLKEPSLSENP